MRPELKKYLRYSPILLGALGGYLYYVFIGCAGGTCPLTSNPWTSTAYGALVGLLLVPRKPKKTSNENSESGS